MTSQPPKPSEADRKALVKRLDRATAAHEKTRRTLDDLVAEARAAGLSLTEISAHSPYSREWVRKIASQSTGTESRDATASEA